MDRLCLAGGSDIHFQWNLGIRGVGQCAIAFFLWFINMLSTRTPPKEQCESNRMCVF